jgi:hypothetical protein
MSNSITKILATIDDLQQLIGDTFTEEIGNSLNKQTAALYNEIEFLKAYDQKTTKQILKNN